MVKRVGFLFPGQGSQQVGMGLDLSEAFAESRAAFDDADAALGLPISNLCWMITPSFQTLTDILAPLSRGWLPKAPRNFFWQQLCSAVEQTMAMSAWTYGAWQANHWLQPTKQLP